MAALRVLQDIRSTWDGVAHMLTMVHAKSALQMRLWRQVHSFMIETGARVLVSGAWS